ncbi:cytochrome d ubiquinol oxidase subunit II [Streptomyces sp. NBRC 109706]|uniref:cytochrome d ubiquinol oxidase subunit II n=1 Tax=Streptomyces sp. NBRC 109706 TaxID=1550035 RepID=UPI00078225A5|nr:cytochrome d ubiquinol oxidase subunit II [Streptomyces sp. NBRC 109706]
MEQLAVLLLSCFTAGYLVTGGAGLGLVMLLPFLGRDADERASLRAATAPFGPLGGLWLLASAGTLLACFPSLAPELGGLAPLLAALLGGTLLRLVGRGIRPRADWPSVAGSWLTVLTWGWLLASLVGGAPVRPAPPAVGLLSAVCVALLVLVHGIGFAALRATGPPFERARQLAGRGAGRSLALTGASLAALPPLAGARLPLTPHAAPTPTLALLTPFLLLALLTLLHHHPPPQR